MHIPDPRATETLRFSSGDAGDDGPQGALASEDAGGADLGGVNIGGAEIGGAEIEIGSAERGGGAAGVRPGPPVLGIGASAGGLEALKALLGAMPAGNGIAFVVVLHLEPNSESLAAEILGRYAAIPVVEVTDGMRALPDRVHVIPPNAYLTIEDGVLRLSDPPARRAQRMPVDHFLRSLAEDRGERALCVILSGAGADGALGLTAIKEQGGLVLAQDPRTAQHTGMPVSALRTGLVDCVLSVEKMPEVLLRYVRHPYVHGGAYAPPAAEQSQDQLKNILALVQARCALDFRSYKKNTLLRRVQRRMGLRQLESLAEYHRYLQDHRDEVRTLVRDLLISVTRFFREPEAWDDLVAQVVGPLLRGEGTGAVRVWVPGCATGEEAYSLAMVFLEQLEAAGSDRGVQVFATDIDQEAIEVARAGVYPNSITADVSQERLERFFRRDGDTFHLQKAVREAVVFAPHNLISDPPFSKLDVISCRNVLIYMEPELQRRLMSLFHFALKEGGYLFLGSSETVGQQGALFEMLSKRWRIYRRREAARRTPLELPFGAVDPGQKALPPMLRPSPRRGSGLADLAEGVLLRHFTPAAVLVDQKHHALYFHGPTHEYVAQPPGVRTDDLLAMVPEELRPQLRAALRAAGRDNQPAVLRGTRIRRGSEPVPIKVTVTPVPRTHDESGLALVTFEDEERQPAGAPGLSAGSAGDEALIRQLEEELQAVREELQSTIEEMDTSNEELRASHEEVMAMNEELQSTNEELETSKEELQSLNEELVTLNAQLQEKITELEAATDDLSNLLSSTNIATIFLDTSLRIKRFTPATGKLFNLIPSDASRPLGDIARKFTDEALLADARAVLDSFTPAEREVQTDEDGRWYVRRIQPYRTHDQRIGGVVITFVDITELKRAQEHEARLAAIVESTQVAVIGKTLDAVITSWNRGAEQTYGYTAAEAIGRHVSLVVPPDRIEELRPVYERLRRGERVETFESERVRKDGARIHVAVTLSPMRDGRGAVVGASAISRDITRHKRAEEALRHSEERLALAVRATNDAIWDYDVATGQIWSNEAYLRLFGARASDAWGELVHPDDRAAMVESFRAAMEGRSDRWQGEYRFRRADGSYAHVLDRAVIARGPDGRPTRVLGAMLDLTERKQAEERLRESEERFRTLADSAPVLIWLNDVHDCEFVNRSYLDFTGMSLEQIRGMGWTAALHPDDVEAYVGCYRRAVEERGQFEAQCRHRRADGEYRWMKSIALPRFTRDGVFLGYVGCSLDITDLKRTEEALKEADRHKNEFLAMLAHELRNPLAPIRNALHVLRMPNARSDELEAVRAMMERQVQQMVRLVDDLLDVSRITTGKIRLERRAAELGEIVRNAVEECRPLITARRHELIVSMPEEPLRLVADGARVSQVVANLLHNAAKFTEEGGQIALSARREGEEIVVSVRDSGIGIEPEMLPRVFELFRQAERSLDRALGGLGLGLTLVQTLVGMHGGSVRAFSEGPGRGSEFVLRLPVGDPAGEAGAERAGGADRGEGTAAHGREGGAAAGREVPGRERRRRILVVDDNRDAAESMGMLLEQIGHDVEEVHDGHAALAAVEASRPEVVLLDIGLPGLDGYEVARRLRERHGRDGLVLVALTGYGQEEDRRRSEASGMDYHLVKPVDPVALEELLASLPG